MYDERPRLALRTEPVDWLAEILGLAALAWLVLPILAARELPERVPTHFDLAGRPDSWGDGSMLLVLAGLGVGLYALLWLVGRIPHFHNFPFDINGVNARWAYTLSTRLLRWLRVFMACVFAVIAHNSLAVARGNEPLPNWILFAALAASIVGPLLLVLLMIRRNRKLQEEAEKTFAGMS